MVLETFHLVKLKLESLHYRTSDGMEENVGCSSVKWTAKRYWLHFDIISTRESPRRDNYIQMCDHLHHGG